MFLLCLFGHIIADHGVDQASPNRPKSKHQISHNSHAVGNSSCDVVEISTVVPSDTGNILGVEALDVDHSKENVTETSSNNDETIDEELLFGVVFEALADHTMEGQVSKERVKGE